MPIPQLSPRISRGWRVEPIGLRRPDGWRRPKRRQPVIFKQLFLILVVLLFLFGFFSLGIFLWIAKDLPNPEKLMERQVSQSTKIYDRTGKIVLYEIHGAERRTLVELHQIPQYLIQATIVTEDKDFYHHKGFNLKAIIRALWKNLTRRGQLQGGSTITQQLIKNSILTPQKSYIRKIKELILAYQIEKKFSKDQILKMYLNEIAYGNNAYGIEAAARIYFNKKAADLTLAESALLVSLPKAPTYYSPYGSHQKELLARQRYILDSMVEQGYITKEEADLAKRELVLAALVPPREPIQAPHFVMYVKELLSSKYGQSLVEKGGLKVITTLDTNLQETAEAIIKEQAKVNLENYGASNAALVSIDPRTGQILAMVGSKDYFDQAIDGQVNVCIRPRQPGSSFKPFVYAKAFEKGYTPETIIFDVVTDFGPSGDKEEYIPHNYDGLEHGPVTMRQGLAGSLNIASVKTLYLTGINNVLDLADKLGYTTLKDRSRFGLSLVLGGAEVKLLEHTAAFAVLAQEGIKRPTQAILKIEDAQGQLVEEFSPEQGIQVMDAQISRLITSIISDDASRSFVFGPNSMLNLPDRPAAAKTGTTNDFRDGWTIGYTPTLVTGVWAGNNDNREMRGKAAGINVAAPIWNRFMRKALEDQPPQGFTPPKEEKAEKSVLAGQIGGEVKVKIDKISGKLATELTPETCIEEKTFYQARSILHYLDKNNPRGDTPEAPENDPQYARWEQAIQKWIKEQNWEGAPPEEYDDIHKEELKPTVKILSPEDKTDIDKDIIEIWVEAQAPRGVKRVECLINGKIADVDYNKPYRCQANLTGLGVGWHKIGARAYDDLENNQLAERDFLLQAQYRASFYWQQLKDGQTFSKISFPLKLELLGPARNYQTIKFFYQKIIEEETSPPSLMATIFDPAQGSRISHTWQTPPPAGQYQLYVEATDQEGRKIESERIKIGIR